MRNLKKLFAVVLVIAVMLTAMVPAFAEGTTTAISPDAQSCVDLGMLTGDNGVTAAYTATQPARIQALVMLLRLKGVLAAAQATPATADNFADVTAGWMKPLTAYAKAHPEIGFGGIGNNKFDPNSLIDAKQYYSILLTSLGYKAPDDYTWDTVATKAAAVGLKKLDGVTKVTIADIATATVEGLKTKIKDGSKTLAEDLLAKGVFSKDQAVKAGVIAAVPTSLTVTSVAASNMKEIVVTFSSEVDKTTAENKDAYTLTKGVSSALALDSASLQDDKKSVVLVPTAALTNQATDYKLAVSGIKAVAGTSVASAKDLKFTPVDAALPTVVKVEGLGNKAVKVTASEPIQLSSTVAATCKIDDVVVSGTPEISGRTMIISLYNTLTAGKHKLSINNNVIDFASYQLVATSADFDVVADTVAPTIAAAKDVTLESVTVVFSEDVQKSEATNKDNYLWKQGTDEKKATAVTQIDSKTYKVDFSGNRLPGYTTDLFVKNVKDFSNNAIAADSKIAVTAQLDQSRPEVITSVFDEGGRAKMTITFTKAIDSSSFKASNVTIKDKDSKVVSNGYSASVNGKVVTVNFSSKLDAGTYTFEISGLKDLTLLANTMMPYSTSITAKNTTQPVAGATLTGANPNFIISFDKEMDVSTLLSYDSYYITYNTADTNGITGKLPAGTNLAPVNSNKGVIITLPSGITAVTKLVVQGVKDVDGNVLSGYSKEYTAFTNALTMVAAKATATDTIKVKMNQPVGTVKSDGSDFAITGNPIKSAAIDSGDNSVIVLTLTSATFAADNTTVKVTSSASSNTKGITGTDLKVDGTGIVIADAIAPTVLKDNASDPKIIVNGTGAGITVTNTAGTHTLAVTFNENIKDKNDTKIYENFKVYKADGVALESGIDYKLTVGDFDGTKKVVSIDVDETAAGLKGYDGELQVVFDNSNGNIIDNTAAKDFDGTTEIDSKANGFDTSKDCTTAGKGLIRFDEAIAVVGTPTIAKTAAFWGNTVGDSITINYSEAVKPDTLGVGLTTSGTSVTGKTFAQVFGGALVGVFATPGDAGVGSVFTVALSADGKTVTITVTTVATTPATATVAGAFTMGTATKGLTDK